MPPETTTTDEAPEAEAANPEAVAQLREQLEQIRPLLDAGTAAKMADLLDRMEAGDITEEEAQAEAEEVYAGMMAAVTNLGGDPAALGLAPAPEAAPQPALGVPGIPGTGLVEQLARAEAQGFPVVLAPAQAGELADLANFAVWARDEMRPVLEGLRPLVDRIAAVGPELTQAGPLQLAQLVLGSFAGKA